MLSILATLGRYFRFGRSCIDCKKLRDKEKMDDKTKDSEKKDNVFALRTIKI